MDMVNKRSAVQWQQGLGEFGEHFFLLLIEIFIEIIVDSHAIVRNNTRSFVHFVHFPQWLHFAKL